MTGSDRRNAPKRTRRGRLLTPEEEALWAHVTRHDTRFHPEGGVILPPEPPAPPPASGRKEPPRPSPTLKETPTAPPQRGVYDNIDRRTAERFRRGEKRAEAALDLHGLREPVAHLRFREFLESSYQRGRRVVLIVTGKGREGQGVLRAALPRWLEEPDIAPLVLAFDYAQRRDGGSGAYYVL